MSMSFLYEHSKELFAILGALSVLGGLVARLTPNKADDAFMAKFQAFLDRASAMFLHPAQPPKADE